MPKVTGSGAGAQAKAEFYALQKRIQDFIEIGDRYAARCLAPKLEELRKKWIMLTRNKKTENRHA